MTGPLPLAYAGRLNSFHGPSGGGKTWLAVHAVAEAVQAGHEVVVIDYEDHPNGWALRLVQIGVTPDQAALIDYVNPAGDLLRTIGQLRARAERLGRRWTLVIVDSIGEAISRTGGNPNDDRDVAPFMTTARLLTKLPGDPGVVLLDHVTKAAEDSQEGPSLHAAGSFRKRAAIDGASYAVEVKQSPAKGKPGRLGIYTAKDRHGNRPQRSLAAHAELEPVDGPIEGCLTIRLVAPKATADSDGKFRPSGLMEKTSRWLELNPGATGRKIAEAVRGNHAARNAGLALLIEEGYVAAAGSRNSIAHTSLKPYREADDPHRAQARPSAPEPRPGRGPESPEVERAHAPRAPHVVGLGVGALDGSGNPPQHPTNTTTAPTPPNPEGNPFL